MGAATSMRPPLPSMRILAYSCWAMSPCWTRLIGIPVQTKWEADSFGVSKLATGRRCQGLSQCPHQSEGQNQHCYQSENENRADRDHQEAVLGREVKHSYWDAKEAEHQ